MEHYGQDALAELGVMILPIWSSDKLFKQASSSMDLSDSRHNKAL